MKFLKLAVHIILFTGLLFLSCCKYTTCPGGEAGTIAFVKYRVMGKLVEEGTNRATDGLVVQIRTGHPNYYLTFLSGPTNSDGRFVMEKEDHLNYNFRLDIIDEQIPQVYEPLQIEFDFSDLDYTGADGNYLGQATYDFGDITIKRIDRENNE